ncbi:fimbrial protein [Avibacterium paragallinarum]|uniref:fimbrial protein n=1 Tax=Avibacterium paragallinarum TaxID=728 RepID=UPI00021ACF1A|nr:fimbrial protein [Avibacterium paragallinarum]AZI14082.1 hypothetical protein EIA51_05275 [Avibacterium paragallinarum]QIR11551.1 fimbrial protein [Avibacterium paragallinarum]QJE09475.1 fimbrial protein [Avibacterium paragallinarum]QJE11671.1 fimbrial protein [Avibacterium paragallinarum]QJE13870.1 fimbrial protein [Avibacterium paragallinarum]
MKKQIILMGICSLFFILLPEVKAATMTIDGITVGIPEEVRNGVTKPVTHHQEVANIFPFPEMAKKKIIYSWRLENSERYCLQHGEYRSPVDKYHMEVKFYPLALNIDNKFFNQRILINDMKVYDNDPYQRFPVSGSQSMYFTLELSLKDEALYRQAIDYTVKKGTKLGVMTLFCTTGSREAGHEGEFRDHRSLYNAFTGFTLTTAEDASFRISRTCSLSSASSQTVTLSPVMLSDIQNNQKIKGGDFTIRLDCSGVDIKNAYIAFADAIKEDQKNSLGILNVKEGAGYAQGVNIMVEDAQTQQPVRFKQLLSDPLLFKTDYPSAQYGSKSYDALTLFGSLTAGQTILSRKYNVYYWKFMYTQTAGNVEARIRYNIYYN